MEHIAIIDTEKTLEVKSSCIDNAQFFQVMLNGAAFNDISMTSAKITNANLSGLEIEGAQIGGAFIHNIGMPPKGHPFYNAAAKQRPARFEDCDLNNSTFTSCNLEGVSISDCNIDGLQINGVLIKELLEKHG